MQLVTFFKLIRWKNILLLIYVQLLLKLLLFPSFKIDTNLNYFQFSSIVLIASAGYIINGIFDVKTDTINKPKKVIITKQITIEKAKQWYLMVNTLGIFTGIILSLNIQKPTFSFLFIFASLLLYYYSKKYKPKPLIGNLIVSFLIAFSIIILYLFELSETTQSNSQELVKNIILSIALFSFFINLIREIVKDIEDINGDYNLNMRTLPIVIGVKRTKYLAAILCVIPISLLLFVLVKYTAEFRFTILYLLFFVLLPLLYVALKLRIAKTKKDFYKLSAILKIIMFLGINSIILISINY